MPDTGAPWNIPYVAGTDLVADWPTDSQTLAEAIADGLDAASKLKQVVSTTKTDAFAGSSTGWFTLTGLTATITPTSATSTVLAILTVGAMDASGASRKMIRVTRGGTAIGVGDAAGSRTQTGLFVDFESINRVQSSSWSFLDSPATTSATTYTAEGYQTGGTFLLNRQNSDSDNNSVGRAVSTLTVMEIAA